MAIPKAAPGEEFAYDYQYAIFVRTEGTAAVFLDRYAYTPAYPVTQEEEQIWISAEDARRIYAPYLSMEERGEQVIVTYGTPLNARQSFALNHETIRRDGEMIRLDLAAVAKQLNKPVWFDGGFAAIGVDAPEGADNPVAGFRPKIYYRNILNGKDRGQMYFSLWYEPANRVIPYRMYIPSYYDPKVPMKTVVCFHGGDANADYMFRHTKDEICEYAERRGYILLALTSYRKFTFFGASRIPVGTENFDPNVENPLGLDSEQWESCLAAETSVPEQIKDAASRYTLDMDHMYALGNSGGSLGIFRQVEALGRPFFRSVACGGGVASPAVIDYDRIRETRTKFLIVYGSEDEFDGQQILRTNMPALLAGGLDAKLHIVGGGDHLTGWTHALDTIFRFYEENE